jgi:hypothetical protein
MAEPHASQYLCRTRTHDCGSQSWSTVEVDIYVPPGTEVELWPAGVVRVDSLPTRDQIREALSTKVAPAARPRMLHVEDAVDAVMALLGQAEGATP